MNIEDLKEMTKKELLAIANGVFDLKMNGSYAKEQILEAIQRAQGKYKGQAEVNVLSDNDDSTKVKPGYVKIRLQPGRYNPKNRPVFVSHNFKPALIPVNKDVILPVRYLTVLQDAVQRRYHQEDGEDGKPELVMQEEHSYPFSILERG
jgi:hypothetical protein